MKEPACIELAHRVNLANPSLISKSTLHAVGFQIYFNVQNKEEYSLLGKTVEVE